MKFYYHEPDNKRDFELRVEQDFTAWLFKQNQRIKKAWPEFKKDYAKKIENKACLKMLFRYLYTCGNFE